MLWRLRTFQTSTLPVRDLVKLPRARPRPSTDGSTVERSLRGGFLWPLCGIRSGGVEPQPGTVD